MDLLYGVKDGGMQTDIVLEWWLSSTSKQTIRQKRHCFEHLKPQRPPQGHTFSEKDTPSK